MILDTSVLIAIIQREPGWEHHQRRLEEAALLRISAGTLQELLVVAHCRAVLEPVEALLGLLDPDVVPVDAELAHRALAVYQRFGKGLGHAAQLNFGDCFAAALAEREQLPLAYAGQDFAAAGF
ncbi:type II toxin-antitoxin system VapC family toxin [Cyanobium sp. FGCU-6]|nr:type II toxin-antitoxin system VapC family toxin [Cyanobium sp. FGCU6]